MFRKGGIIQKKFVGVSGVVKIVPGVYQGMGGTDTGKIVLPLG